MKWEYKQELTEEELKSLRWHWKRYNKWSRKKEGELLPITGDTPEYYKHKDISFEDFCKNVIGLAPIIGKVWKVNEGEE